MLFTGQLSLEWETLSKYTGNRTYADLTIGALAHIAQLVCFRFALLDLGIWLILSQPAPLPGLAAQGIDPRTGEFVGGYVVRCSTNFSRIW